METRPQKQLADRAAGLWDWWERSRSLLEQLGLRQTAGVFVVNGALFLAAWFYENVPWYLAFVLFLLAASVTLHAFHKFQIIRKTSKFNPRDYQKFGGELVQLSQEIFRFLADRQRDHSDFHRANPRGDGVPGFAAWQADRDFEAVTGRLFFERFGPRVTGSLALLQRIGITMPHHMIVTAYSRPNGLPQFLGTIGDLLSRGNIADAIAISNDRDFMWQISI